MAYQNLVTGKEYILRGVLMDKATKKPLLVNGKQVTAEKAFTVTKAHGVVELEFTFDSSALKDKAVVVFERLYYGENEIAVHTDINDENQTVRYHTPEEPPKTPKTGDSVSVMGILAVFVLSLCGAFVLLRKDKKEEEYGNKEA